MPSATVETPALHKCSWCGCDLDDSDDCWEETPDDGATVCRDCYEEHYEDSCVMCEETFLKSEYSGADDYFIVGTSSLDNCDIDSRHLRPGLYKITGYPFYADGIIFMDLYYDRWQRVGELFRADPPDFDGYPMGRVCPDCVTKRRAKAEEIARTGVERMSIHEWRDLVRLQRVSAEHRAFRCPACGHVQSAITLARQSGIDLDAAQDCVMCLCGSCGLSLDGLPGDADLLARSHNVSVDVGSGKMLPVFAPITPEGAVRFMTGGKEARCRACGNTHVSGENHWVEPDLCFDCRQYLERKQRVCRLCGRTGEQIPFGGLSITWAEQDLCSACVSKERVHELA